MIEREPKRVLITGGTGFVGRYLSSDILINFPSSTVYITGRGDYFLTENLRYVKMDLKNSSQVSRVIKEVQPDVVFHLAAQANVSGSFIDPLGTWETNLQGSLNLFDALGKLRKPPILFNVGSSDMYGASFLNGPASEDTVLAPMNPYAASKAAADMAAFSLSKTTDVKVVRLRPFNHSGPGQGEGYVIPALAAQIARIEAGMQSAQLMVGDLSSERDFLHVKDVVRAYTAIMSISGNLASGTALNICSGVSHSISDLLNIMIAGSTAEIEINYDSSRFRKSDIPVVLGKNQSVVGLTGWNPSVSIKSMLLDVLGYWRAVVKKSGSASI